MYCGSGTLDRIASKQLANYGASCHMGSHSVTIHSTQVNTTRLNPSQTARYTIYLSRRDGTLS